MRFASWQAEHRQPQTPIIALTAQALAGDRQRCLDTGMDTYLTKPIRAQVLLACLKQTIAPGVKQPVEATPDEQTIPR